MTGLLESALRYAARGLPVFPCEPRGKRPLTRNGLKDATTDAEQINRLWRDVTANVAIRTGRESGLIVVDVDEPDGADTLAYLERRHTGLPKTASVKTPTGGQHYYFRHPGGEVRNSAGQLGVGLDIRGDGGYVLAPPSIGANGRRYETDERVPLADPPYWLLPRPPRRDAATRTPASEWLAIVRDGLAEGERNHGLARLAGHLLARDVDARLVLELALAVNRARCRPPLSDAEVDGIVESIAGRELRKRNGRP